MIIQYNINTNIHIKNRRKIISINNNHAQMDVAFSVRRKEYSSYCRLGSFQTPFRVWVMVSIEDPTVTVKCTTAIKQLFIYFSLCLSVKLYSLSCSFTHISFLTKCYADIFYKSMIGRLSMDLNYTWCLYLFNNSTFQKRTFRTDRHSARVSTSYNINLNNIY